MGLPGDYSPPGRFVRAAVQLTLSDQPKDGHDAEITALHILNTHLIGQRYSYRTVTDPNVYSVDLGSVDFTAPARTQVISWSGSFVGVDVK